MAPAVLRSLITAILLAGCTYSDATTDYQGQQKSTEEGGTPVMNETDGVVGDPTPNTTGQVTDWSGKCVAIDGGFQSATPWAGGAPYSHPAPSYTSNGAYCVLARDEGGSATPVFCSTPGANGNLTTWTKAYSRHQDGLHGTTAVTVENEAFSFRNGHILRYTNASGQDKPDELDSRPHFPTSDDKAIINPLMPMWDAAVYARFGTNKGFVVHLSGFTDAGTVTGGGHTYFTDVLIANVPLTTNTVFAKTLKQYPGSRSGKSAYFAASTSKGFIYTRPHDGSNIQFISVDSSGKLGDWLSAGSVGIGDGDGRGDVFVVGRTLFVVRGSIVYSANLDPNTGAIQGSLTAQSARLPNNAPQIGRKLWDGGELEGAAWGVVKDYVYLTGEQTVYSAHLKEVTCSQ